MSKRVEHQVWFKFKPGISDERIEHHAKGLAALKGKIPGILEIKVGRNFTDRAPGFGLGLSVTLESKDALEVYGPHPEHKAVAGPLRADCDDVMAVDFEF